MYGTFYHDAGTAVSCYIVDDAGIHKQIPGYSKSYQEPACEIQTIPRRKAYHHTNKKFTHKNQADQIDAGICSDELPLLRDMHVHHIQRMDECKLYSFRDQPRLFYDIPYYIAG